MGISSWPFSETKLGPGHLLTTRADRSSAKIGDETKNGPGPRESGLTSTRFPIFRTRGTSVFRPNGTLRIALYEEEEQKRIERPKKAKRLQKQPKEGKLGARKARQLSTPLGRRVHQSFEEANRPQSVNKSCPPQNRVLLGFFTSPGKGKESSKHIELLYVD
jgi:hypothetical protein